MTRKGINLFLFRGFIIWVLLGGILSYFALREALIIRKTEKNLRDLQKLRSEQPAFLRTPNKVDKEALKNEIQAFLGSVGEKGFDIHAEEDILFITSGCRSEDAFYELLNRVEAYWPAVSFEKIEYRKKDSTLKAEVRLGGF